MKIRRIGVQSVLHYDNFDLDFGDRAAGLHILHGPNEAGKSTLLRLLVDLLFGVQSGEGLPEFYDSKSRVEGVLQAAGQPDLHLQRKKNRARLVLDGTDIAEDELIATYLGGYEKERFTLLFGFDHEKLRIGGEGLLQSGGHAGVSLFEAGGGVQYLQNLLGRLTAQSENLLDSSFMARSAKLLNKTWRAYQDAEKTIRQSSLRGEEWHRKRDEIDRLERRITELQEQMRARQRETARLTRIQRVRGMLGELREIRRQIADMGEVVVLPADMDRHIPELLGSLRELTRKLDERAEERARLIELLQAIPLDDVALAHREEAEALGEGLQQYETRRAEELPKLHHMLQQRRQDAEQQLKSIVPGASVDDAEPLRISVIDQERIEKLAADLRQAKLEVSAAQKRCEETAAQKMRITESLATLSEAPDVTELRALLQEIRTQGDLGEAIAQRDAEIALRRKELTRMLATQAVWRGSLEEAATLPVPLRETVDQYVDAWARLQQQARDAERALEDARDRSRAVSRELETLERKGAVPVESDLTAVRLRRDAGWRMVKRAWLGSEADANEGDAARAGAPAADAREVNAIAKEDAALAFIADVPLDAAFEAAMRAADDTADWMRRDADVSAQRGLLLGQTEQIGRDIEALTQKCESLAVQFATLSQRWAGEWDSSGIEPKSPVEMKEFLTTVHRPLVDGLRSLQALEAEHAALMKKRDWAIDALTRQCGALGSDHEVRAEAEVTSQAEERRRIPRDLQTLLQRCDRIVNEAAEQEAQRQRLIAQQQQIDDAMRVQTRSVTQVRDALEALEAAWAALRVRYPALPEDADFATKYVRTLQEVFAKFDEAKRLRSDLDAKEAACAAFEERVLHLASTFGEPIDESNPNAQTIAASVRHARDRLRVASSAAEQRKRTEQEVARVDQLTASTEGSLRQVQAELAQIQADYRCPDTDALHGLVQQSIARKQAAATQQGYEQHLLEWADGLSVAELDAEFSAEPDANDVDALRTRIDALRAEISELKAQMEGENRQLVERQIAFDALDGTQTAAADSAQQAEAHLAEVDRLWNEYLRVELARRLLQRAIEEFREQNQSSILGRANDFFRRLTVGHFRELAVEHDGNDPYLEAVRADGSKRRVHQMSDGTRDQLFLSLRLAFVEQHLASSDPLPLIMDDILVHFDDERTKATLDVLHELAAKTQILYFTHHQSVVEAVSGAGGAMVHRLG